jgi:hypothetical protein
MPGLVLHAGAQVACFHAAPATVAPAGPRVLVSGQPVATLATLPVAGCPFQVPVPGGTKPQPCVTVNWLMVSARVLVNGQPVLLQTPPGPGTGPGLCKSAEQIPQGAPQVRAMQTRVIAS